MIDRIETKEITYYAYDLGAEVTHHVLIAHENRKQVLLSYPNLFLYSCTRSARGTSARYASLLSMLYKFLSTLPEFKDVESGRYHAVVTNKHIKRWQVHRQVVRQNKGRTSPTCETTINDAKVLLNFFRWLIESGCVTGVQVLLKTAFPNFKNKKMLSYIDAKARIVIDGRNISVLERESRQKRKLSLITNKEISLLAESYTDPVYSAMFKFALGTAMRPSELCKFPLYGNGVNKHIAPQSEMRNSASPIVKYTVIRSKRGKTREIAINQADLKELERTYITPHYRDRAKLYKEKYGKDCPPSILFLTKAGDPVDGDRISRRTTDAKKKAMAKDESFRSAIRFYDSRGWWPTMFLIKFFKDDLLTKSADALYAACAEAIRQQLGHEDIDTTYKHYIDMARLLLMAHQGKVNELITAPEESVSDFMRRMDEGLW